MKAIQKKPTLILKAHEINNIVKALWFASSLASEKTNIYLKLETWTFKLIEINDLYHPDNLLSVPLLLTFSYAYW